MSKESTLLVQLQRPDGSWVDVGLVRKSEPKNWFEFLDSYWRLADRPVLGQIFEEQGSAWKPSAHVALPHWFSHLLPEGRLRQAVADVAHISEKREFELLGRLGADDLPGALRAVPVVSPNDLTTPPELNDGEGLAYNDDPLLKFSLAGAQLKFSLYSKNRGLTVPAKGQAGNVILKFPDERIGFSGVPESELGCLELARLAGMDTARAELWAPQDVEGLEAWAAEVKGQALAVHRFDRPSDGQKRHMEELAQVMNIPTRPLDIKYRRGNFETVALHVSALAGPDSVGEVIDRIVLNVLVGNGDAHLKNWAFVYHDGRLPSLSPLYDVLPTVLYVAEDDLGLKLGKNKKFESVGVGDFETLGMRSSYGAETAVGRAREAVQRVLSNWSVLKDHLSADHFSRLSERLNTLKIVQDA